MPETSIDLSPAAARVLGCLMEKEATTPEYYPLSMLALINACNQRSSRSPLMELAEDEVRLALHQLEDAGLAAPVRGTESRVAKFAHHIGEVFNLRRGEHALLCLLLLRGPQTPGELRGRAERLYAFSGIEDVEASLQQLGQREPPLARALPREPGARELRYVHLLSPVAEGTVAASHEPAETAAGGRQDRIGRLEAEIADLRARLAAIEQALAQRQG